MRIEAFETASFGAFEILMDRSSSRVAVQDRALCSGSALSLTCETVGLAEIVYFRGALVAETQVALWALIPMLTGAAEVLLDVEHVDRIDSEGLNALCSLLLALRDLGGIVAFSQHGTGLSGEAAVAGR